MSVKYSKRYDLPDVFKYDSVNTFTLTFKDWNDWLIDMTGADVIMTFLLNGKEYSQLTIWDWISISGSVVTISMQPFKNEGSFSYDVQVVKDDVKRTYIYWNILVHNEITKW